MNNNNNNKPMSKEEAQELLKQEEMFWRMIETMPEPTELSPLLASDEELKNNPLFSAIQNLDDEAPPEEMAEGYKNSGNSKLQMALKEKKDPRLKKKFFQDAVDFYTRAINEKSVNRLANSTYYSNRAQAQLYLQGYGHAIDDCQHAVDLNPTNIKAYFRAAKAAFLLDRLQDAISWCKKGLQVDPTNIGIREIAQKLYQRLIDLQNRKDERQKEIQQRLQDQKEFDAKLEQKGLVLGKQLYDATIYHNKINIDEKGLINISVLFLYPQYSQSDFVQLVSQEDTLQDHLLQMFPSKNLRLEDSPEIPYPAWDEKKEYFLENLSLYIETACTPPLSEKIARERKDHKRRFIRVLPTTIFAKILFHKEYVVPQFPVVFVFVKGSTSELNFLKSEKQQDTN